MNIDQTLELSDYEPSEKELALLRVLLNPEHANKTITDKVEIAGIDRSMYYYYMKKPDFLSLIRSSSMNLVSSGVTDIIHAFMDKAKGGSFKHGKVLLEMAGMHSDSISIDNSTVNVIVGGKNIEKMGDRELIRLAEEQGIRVSEREKQIIDAKYKVIDNG